MNATLFVERFAMRLVGLALLICTLAFLANYPKVISVFDEAAYIRQASRFGAGIVTLAHESANGGEHRGIEGAYLPGTSVIMAPWVALFGWRGAFLASFVCFCMTIVVTARWLRDQALSPLFSLVLLLYPATVASSRLAMSDWPSACLVTLGLWQFWRALGGNRRAMFVSGLFAGLSMAFRETNAIVLAPFFLGGMLRKDRHWHLALAGGLMGCSVRFALSWVVFGSPFFHARSLEFFTSNLTGDLAWKLLCMIILLPGGLIFPLFYEGPRSVELRISAYGFFAFYSVYSWFGLQSGPLKALVLGGRFFLPICPLLIITIAEVASSLRKQWPSFSSAVSEVLWRKVSTAAAVTLFIIACISGVGVHWIMDRYSRTDAEVIKTIYQNTAPGSVVLTNTLATGKWLNEMYGDRIVGELSHFDRISIFDLLRRKGSFYIVMLQRSDSEFWVHEHLTNQALLAAILHGSNSVVIVDRPIGPAYRLWICRVSDGVAASIGFISTAKPLPYGRVGRSWEDQ